MFRRKAVFVVVSIARAKLGFNRELFGGFVSGFEKKWYFCFVFEA